MSFGGDSLFALFPGSGSVARAEAAAAGVQAAVSRASTARDALRV